MAKHSVAGICVKDGKVFIAKRIDKGQMANRWEFPGGKCEDGEDDRDSLKREFDEEFGIRIEAGGKIAESEFYHGEEKRELYAFEIFFEVPEKGFALTEHTATDWVEFSQIENLSFVDSDLKILPQLRKHFGL